MAPSHREGRESLLSFASSEGACFFFSAPPPMLLVVTEEEEEDGEAAALASCFGFGFEVRFHVSSRIAYHALNGSNARREGREERREKEGEGMPSKKKKQLKRAVRQPLSLFVQLNFHSYLQRKKQHGRGGEQEQKADHSCEASGVEKGIRNKLRKSEEKLFFLSLSLSSSTPLSFSSLTFFFFSLALLSLSASRLFRRERTGVPLLFSRPLSSFSRARARLQKEEWRGQQQA